MNRNADSELQYAKFISSVVNDNGMRMTAKLSQGSLNIVLGWQNQNKISLPLPISQTFCVSLNMLQDKQIRT